MSEFPVRRVREIEGEFYPSMWRRLWDAVRNLNGGDNVDERRLPVDQALLNVTTDRPLSLYYLSDDCHRCPLVLEREVDGNEVLEVSTKYPVTWRLYENRTETELDYLDSEGLVCHIRPSDYGQFGLYSASYVEEQCTVRTQIKPVDIYTPLAWIGGGLVILAVLWALVSFIVSRCSSWRRRRRKRRKNRDEDHSDEDEGDSPPPPVPSSRRVASIDTFRGISIALMIFVNSGGGQYWFFDHATWNGLHVADLVFPWFMWIMGVCIPIAIGSLVRKGTSRGVVFINIIRRSLILFLLGLALNTIGVGPDLSKLRIMGVLQRFSICYFTTASLILFLTYSFDNTNSVPELFADVIHLLPHWVAVLLIMAGHCYLTFFFHVPNCPKGYLGPGGLDHLGAFKNCTGGATGYIDRILLGNSHIYQHPTSQEVYRTGPFDPEGLIGCLTSIIQVFLGVQAGVILRYYRKTSKGVLVRYLIWGTLLGILGAILCQARQDGGWIPVNKNLWSLSYVFVTSSFAFFLLAFLYYVIDMKRIWNGGPFLYPGMNAMILYVGHQVCYEMFPWHWRVGPMNTHLVLTLENLWATLLWILVSYWLYRQNFFLSV